MSCPRDPRQAFEVLFDPEDPRILRNRVFD